jgi:hypothetical protein
MRPRSIWLGLVLLAIAACGLLDASGLVASSDTIGQWWPLAVVTWPVAEMLADRKVTAIGAICVGVGVALLTDVQEWVGDLYVWSILAGLAGVAILAAAGFRREQQDGGRTS